MIDFVLVILVISILMVLWKAAPIPMKIVEIKKISDFPIINGIITLEQNTKYIITNRIY